MAYDIDRIAADAFIAVIGASALFTGVPVQLWKDASEDEVYPVILVHTSDFSSDNVDPSSGELFELIVDLGCRTSENYDKDRKILSAWLGKICSLVFDKEDPVIDKLNLAAASESLRFNGIHSPKGSTGTADGINTGSISFLCRVQHLPEVLS